MANYLLNSERRKSVSTLVTNENVPENVKYIAYKGGHYERSTALLSTGKPDPYLWNEVEGELEEGALIVDGKELISTSDRGQTWKRDHAKTVAAMDFGDISPAEVIARMDAQAKQIEELTAQVAQAGAANEAATTVKELTEANTSLAEANSQLQSELEELRAQLAAAQEAAAAPAESSEAAPPAESAPAEGTTSAAS